MVDKVIRALEAAGISNITVIDVRAIWTGLTRVPDLRYSLELAERYMNVVKLETLVRDEDGPRVLDLIRDAARTGRPGDGIVYALRPALPRSPARAGRTDADRRGHRTHGEHGRDVAAPLALQ